MPVDLTKHYLTYAFLCATSEQELVVTGVSADELVTKGLDQPMVEKHLSMVRETWE